MIVARKGRNGILVRRRDENRNRIEEKYSLAPFFMLQLTTLTLLM